MFRMLALLVLLLTGIGATAGAVVTVAEPAPGRFLVAQRGLYGQYFAQSVVYLLQHDEAGSVGVVLNRPLDLRVADLLPDTHAYGIGSFPVYEGGPLSPHTMVMVFRGDYPTSLALHVRDDVYASSYLKMLEQLEKADKPSSELRLFAGQASWGSGQLQQEVDNQSWYVITGDTALLFEGDPGHLWQRLINQIDPLGIIANNCSPSAALPCAR